MSDSVTPNEGLSNAVENYALDKTSKINMDLLSLIATNNQTFDDIKMLTSSKVNDQLKVFLIAQARNELTRVIKLTKFLDVLENNFISTVTDSINDDEVDIKTYSDVIEVITSLLQRSNDIISKILRDDSLTTILNTTVYTADSTTTTTSVVANLKDPSSRERVRSVIQNILLKTNDFQEKTMNQNDDEDKPEVIEGTLAND